jgi:hypothetical protein
MVTSVVLAERSSAACALASWQDQLYIAWTGTDLHLNVLSSAHWGEFTGQRRLAQRSYRVETSSSSRTGADGSTSSSSSTDYIPLAPALAGSGQQLYLAWRDPDGALRMSGAGPGAGPVPVKFGERSTYAPALTVAEHDRPTLAWTGTDRHVNVVGVTDDPAAGSLWLTPPKQRLEQARTSSAPAVCSYRGALALAWTGSDRRVNLLTDAADPSRPPVRLEHARTSSAPAVCSHGGSLVLAWTGGDRRVNLLTDAADPSRPPVRLDQARTSSAPALCSHGGSLLLAWTGSDRRPNLASVS